MRFESQFWRMNCQIFSWLLSSGARGGNGRSEMLLGTLRVFAPCQPAQNVPSSIVRAARHHLAVAHSGLTRMMTLSEFNPVCEGQ
jgi:hypothetical protein